MQVMNDGPVLKKKFRWTFNLKEHKGQEVLEHEAFFIKLNYRPFEDGELNFLNNKPKVDLSHIKDEEQRKRLEQQVFSFVFTSDSSDKSNFYKFVREMAFGEIKSGEWGNWGGVLTLYDGCGFALEKWEMNRVCPVSVNFGDLDYTSCDDVIVECILLYDEVNHHSIKV